VGGGKGEGKRVRTLRGGETVLADEGQGRAYNREDYGGGCSGGCGGKGKGGKAGGRGSWSIGGRGETVGGRGV